MCSASRILRCRHDSLFEFVQPGQLVAVEIHLRQGVDQVALLFADVLAPNDRQQIPLVHEVADPQRSGWPPVRSKQHPIPTAGAVRKGCRAEAGPASWASGESADQDHFAGKPRMHPHHPRRVDEQRAEQDQLGPGFGRAGLGRPQTERRGPSPGVSVIVCPPSPTSRTAAVRDRCRRLPTPACATALIAIQTRPTATATVKAVETIEPMSRRSVRSLVAWFGWP